MKFGAPKKCHLTAVLMLSVSFAAIERAEAACNPATSAATPANNTTVTCSGTTTNQNDPNGWGTGNETGDTINVQTGATVTGTAAGITQQRARRGRLRLALQPAGQTRRVLPG